MVSVMNVQVILRLSHLESQLSQFITTVIQSEVETTVLDVLNIAHFSCSTPCGAEFRVLMGEHRPKQNFCGRAFSHWMRTVNILNKCVGRTSFGAGMPRKVLVERMFTWLEPSPRKMVNL